MGNMLAMKVSEAYEKSRSSELADEIWRFKNPDEPLDTADREYLSWRNSLPLFLDCAHEAGLDNVIVAFEMKTPISNKAIDVVLVGKSCFGENRILLVELKQWTRIKTDKVYNNAKVYVPEARAARRHPFKQLNLYEKNLGNHHSGIQKAKAKGINFKIGKIAYLHNFMERETLYTGAYQDWQENGKWIYGGGADEKARLVRMLEKCYANTYESELLGILEDYDAIMGDDGLAGLERAYKNESSLAMMRDQQIIVDFIIEHLKNQLVSPRKEMIVISGGPGTGKTIVGIRFILEYVRLFNNGRNDNKVIFCLPKSQTVKAMFDAACSVDEEKENEYCCYLDEISHNQNMVVVDEAHRITDLDETLDKVFFEKETKLLILLQDDHQLVRPGEQGTFEAFRRYAEDKSIAFSPMNEKEKQTLTLIDEKRCDEQLLKGITKLFYDESIFIDRPIETIRVFDTIEELEAWKNENAKTSRTKYVFPFCWEWKTKDGKADIDIEIGRFRKIWNPGEPDDQVIWLNDNEDDRVACLYTSQGLDMDNVAFVWWNDLVWDEQNKRWKGNPRALCDDSYRKCFFDRNEGKWEKKLWSNGKLKKVIYISKDEMDLLIKNTYYVMMSRPRQELGIWFKDEATKRHVVEMLDLGMHSSVDNDIPERHKENIVEEKPKAEENSNSYVIGVSNYKIYHKPGCSYANNVANSITFKSFDDAEKAGYRPCYTCKPRGKS